MKFEDAFLSIKTFFLEILGFLLPGFIFGFTLFIFLKKNNQKEILDLATFDGSFYIIIAMSYVIGYVIYGFGEWVSEVKYLNKYLGSGTWKAKTEELSTYKRAVTIINNNIADNDLKIDVTDVRGARNIVMSSLPERENDKIYTFMFRAELSQKTALSIFSIIICALFSVGIDKITGREFGIFKSDIYSTISYVILIFPIFFLIKTFRRFYGIAMKLPFSIYHSSRNTAL